jgi:arylsulfatase A-like enzyme
VRGSPSAFATRLGLAFLGLYCVALLSCSEPPLRSQPNFIIILTDDMGYGDLDRVSPHAASTPNLDRMAAEGLRLSDFYVPGCVCTPTRIGLMTGRYPRRTGFTGGLIYSNSQTGLSSDEITIAEVLKPLGYATICIGKWHLGHRSPGFLPTAQGFDSYFGIPYSNDMRARSVAKRKTVGALDEAWARSPESTEWWDVPLMRDTEVVEQPVDQTTLTERFTDEALRFIDENRDRPFFLYLAHPMPHVPLFVDAEHFDPDPAKAYDRVIEHIDDSTGRILRKLRDLDLERDTVVVFTSDNGPWLKWEHHAGSAAPLREGKGTTYEGGMRVPFIAWAPGRIPAGRVSGELVTIMDLLPTFARLAGAPLPTDRTLDGRDAWDLMSDQPDAVSPHQAFFYYGGEGRLEAVRAGRWKLRKRDEVELYDLQTDISEQHNVAPQNPDVVERLSRRMQTFSNRVLRR